jgi:hypothetical protein
MRTRWHLLSFVAVVSLAGCATIPTGPSVLVLPGPGKTLEQFQADDTFCRQWAAQQAARTAAGEIYGATMQWQYDMPYQQCMFAKGNRVPVAPALNALPPPPPPSEVPPPFPQPPPPP